MSPGSALAANPAPTPCPTDILYVVCTLTGGPTTPPTPAPTPKATPAPPTQAPAAAPAAPPPAAPRPASGGGGGAAPASSGSAGVAARFSNAPFLQSLLDILAHPTTAQQPDLTHFRVPGPITATGRGLPLTAPGDPLKPPDHRAWSVMAALLGGLVAATLVAARTPGGRVVTALMDVRLRESARFPGTRLSRRLVRTARGRRLHAAIVVAALPLVILPAVIGSVGRSPSPVAAQTTGRLGSVASAVSIARAGTGHTIAHEPMPPGDLPVWTQLLSIERDIADQQEALSAQEADLTRTARVAAATTGDGLMAPAPTSIEMDGVQQHLAELVAAHEKASAQLQQNLKAEYTLYRGAVEDPAQKQQLVVGAARAPIPEATKAVNDDLSRIQTQLQQEQVINDARGQLAQIGNLTQAQLDAIMAHRPFIAPELAPISQGFGPTDFGMEPPLNYGGTFYAHFHTGLDLSGPMDSPIHAAADGVVIVAGASTDGAGNLVGYGNYVVVEHPNGFITLYGHLNSLAVKKGQQVHQGEIVGREGSTGWSTGPHLHFEIRLGDQLLDPMPYVKNSLG